MSGNGVNYYDRPYTIVNAEINDMSARADAAISTANSVINQLAAVALSIREAPPKYSGGTIAAPGVSAIAPPDPTKFGEIGDFNDPDFEEFQIDADDIDVEIGDFAAPYALQRPQSPGPIDTSGEPVKPDFGDVTIPEFDVDTTVPPLQALDDIVVPTFEFPTMPTFTATAPEYDIAPPVTELQWVEPTYESELLDDVKARVTEMLAGGTGLPAAIESALFGRARSREDVLALKAEHDAFEAYASKGFTMPPGMLVKQVQAIQEENRLKASALNRDILIESAKWEIENLRFAVTNGIALEQLLQNIFNNAAARAFEAARFRVEADLRLHDSLVTAFNARMQAYQVEAQVFEARIRGEVAKLEAYKIQLEGLRVRGELNKQKVEIFSAMIEAVKNRIQAYVARVESAKAQSDVIRGRIDAYRADVQAYAEKLQARKVAFDAYESAARVEAAMAQGNEAAARAFAATVQAQEAKANVRIQVIRSRIEAMQAAVQKYAAKIQGEIAQVSAQRDAITATAAAYGAEMQRYSAEIGRDTAGRQLEITRQEAILRNGLSYYDIQLREYDAAMTRLIETALVQTTALDSAGRSAAQLAAGAMAAINVSASLSGSANVSDSFSFSQGKQVTWSLDGEDSPPTF